MVAPTMYAMVVIACSRDMSIELSIKISGGAHGHVSANVYARLCSHIYLFLKVVKS